MYKYAFTVFTATFNRAHTLHRVYESLEHQSFRNFEWVIVDDGSTDRTEDLVRRWQRDADFPIRYIWQENSGKHMAVNRGVKEAQGELFLNVDSDNGFVPEALERFKFHWDSIPENKKAEFSAVTCLTKDPNGNLIGRQFPFDPTDSDSIEIHFRYNVSGEKWGFHRAEVMREFPYPCFEGEKALPDSVAWKRISLKYKTRFVNEVLGVYFCSPDSWSSNTHTIRAKNPKGSRIAYMDIINTEYPIPLKNLLHAYANYVRFSCHVGIGIADQIKDVPSLVRWLAAFPVGFLLYLRDKRLLQAQR